MQINPLRRNIEAVIAKHHLKSKFDKQKKLFENNPRHPSLHTEKLEPKSLNLYSFRLNRKWRVVFIVLQDNKIEVVDINPHYE